MVTGVADIVGVVAAVAPLLFPPLVAATVPPPDDGIDHPGRNIE